MFFETSGDLGLNDGRIEGAIRDLEARVRIGLKVIS
jgi:hypothetical protein